MHVQHHAGQGCQVTWRWPLPHTHSSTAPHHATTNPTHTQPHPPGPPPASTPAWRCGPGRAPPRTWHRPAAAAWTPPPAPRRWPGGRGRACALPCGRRTAPQTVLDLWVGGVGFRWVRQWNQLARALSCGPVLRHKLRGVVACEQVGLGGGSPGMGDQPHLAMPAPSTPQQSDNRRTHLREVGDPDVLDVRVLEQGDAALVHPAEADEAWQGGGGAGGEGWQMVGCRDAGPPFPCSLPTPTSDDSVMATPAGPGTPVPPFPLPPPQTAVVLLFHPFRPRHLSPLPATPCQLSAPPPQRT